MEVNCHLLKNQLNSNRNAMKGFANFTCNVCLLKFVSSSAHQQHVNSHTLEAELLEIKPVVVDKGGKLKQICYRCQFCNKEYSKAEECFKHWQDHMPKAKILNISSSQLVRKEHNVEHDSTTVKRPIAPKPWIVNKQLLPSSGIDNVHNAKTDLEKSNVELKERATDDILNIPQFQYGNETFASFEQYKAFKEKSTKQEDDQHTCPFCRKEFKFVQHLYEHKKEMHPVKDPKTNKRYECQYCDEKFLHRRIRDDHEHFHTGKYPFCCQYCAMPFSREHKLKEHEQRHTGIKPFSCTKCDLKFYRKRELQEHMFIHSDEPGAKKFKCGYCDKKFKKLCYVKIHEKTHTGEKPYACRFCEHSFINSGNRRNHELRIHGKDGAELEDVKEIERTKKRGFYKRPRPQAFVYRCRHCKERFNNSFDRKQHEEETHFTKPVDDDNFHAINKNSNALHENQDKPSSAIESVAANLKHCEPTSDSSKIQSTKRHRVSGVDSTVFSEKQVAVQHDSEKIHVPDSVVFQCGTCQKFFNGEEECQTHLASHENSTTVSHISSSIL